MKPYHDLLIDILANGYEKADRTGVGTIGVFGRQMRFDLTQGFPLLTTKKVHFKSVAHELLWFIKGDTNIKYLKENNVSIWDEWADANGELGPIYGYQWRSWPDSRGGHIDQLIRVVEALKKNPNGRRHIVSAWNVSDVSNMALPPCHILFQFYVDDKGLSCQLYQRSADMFLGVPFNIASYSLLVHMVAQVVNLPVSEFIWTGGDCHIYSNHIEQTRELLSREERLLPTLKLYNAVTDIDGFKYDDIVLFNYNPHPAIKAPVAV